MILGSLSVDIIAQESPSPVSPDGTFSHTIEKGQSLYSIAAMYKVTVDDIVRLNPGAQEKIYAGNTLRIPQSNELQQTQFFHTIEPKETLYQLTKKYRVSAKDIIDANPGLSASNFKIGEVIVIPITEDYLKEETQVEAQPQQADPQLLDGRSKCRDMHKVKRRETIFSISRDYGITEQELIAANPELRNSVMKRGSYLCIPYPAAEITKNIEEDKQDPLDVPMSNHDLFTLSKENSKKISTIKAAVILPFLAESANKDEATRMIEYYEGFLMAVDSLKKKGVSIDLHTYDSGSKGKSIQPILAKPEMKNMDIIFGPYYQEHAEPLAEFSKKNNINLVIPFLSKVNEVFTNPSIYLINTPQSYLYSEVYEHFIRKFPNANVLFLQAPAEHKDKEEFIAGLKQQLTSHQIPYQTLKIDESPEVLKNALDPNKANIFIPTSGAPAVLTKCLPQLTLMVRNNPKPEVHLFGYPEWQTQTRDHLSTFYELDTYFYSSFYTNNLFPEAISFSTSYWKWYGKDMLNSYPKYGMLGFDTGLFFLTGLSRYGTNFEEDINKINTTPVQTGFKFERASNWGGFINRKVFFVRFTKDFELIKLNFD